MFVYLHTCVYMHVYAQTLLGVSVLYPRGAWSFQTRCRVSLLLPGMKDCSQRVYVVTRRDFGLRAAGDRVLGFRGLVRFRVLGLRNVGLQGLGSRVVTSRV